MDKSLINASGDLSKYLPCANLAVSCVRIITCISSRLHVVSQLMASDSARDQCIQRFRLLQLCWCNPSLRE